MTQTIAHVVKRADLVVVPTRPSPHDLRAVGPTVDIADTLNKPLVFVVNSATARARITSETAVALSQHGVVAPVTLHHRGLCGLDDRRPDGWRYPTGVQVGARNLRPLDVPARPPGQTLRWD